MNINRINPLEIAGSTALKTTNLRTAEKHDA